MRWRSKAPSTTVRRWLFVAVTALLLYLTLRTQLRRWEAEAAQRRRAEIALRESEERFRTILYSIGDGVIITDSAGTISHMNRIAEELTGWKETEALRKPIQEVYGIVDEKSNAPAEQAVHRALQEGVLVDEPRPTMLVDRKGGRRPITDTAAPIRTPRNDIVGAALVFRD